MKLCRVSTLRQGSIAAESLQVVGEGHGVGDDAGENEIKKLVHVGRFQSRYLSRLCFYGYPKRSVGIGTMQYEKMQIYFICNAWIPALSSTPQLIKKEGLQIT